MFTPNQSPADRWRFELEELQWLAFNAALERPVASPASKERLRALLAEPSILDSNCSCLIRQGN